MSSQHRGDALLRVVLAVVAVVLLAPLLVMALAMPTMGMMGWWWGAGGPGAGISPLWGIASMAALVVVLLVVGYVLVRALVGSGRDPAIAELRTAYARGDLTDEEYEERLQRLRGED